MCGKKLFYKHTGNGNKQYHITIPKEIPSLPEQFPLLFLFYWTVNPYPF